MNDKPEPVPAKVKDTQPAPEEHKSGHLPNLLDLAGDLQAGLIAAKHTVYDKATGTEQLLMQVTNAATEKTLGVSAFSKDSINALAPQQRDHASAHSLKGYFEAVGAAAPLAVAALVAHKFFGAAGAKEVLSGEKALLTGEKTALGAESVTHPGVLSRAKTFALRDTPIGLSVRNAGALGFASEFVNPTDTRKDDSLAGSLKTRAIDGSIGAFSMAAMAVGTVGAQAAWKAVGRTAATDVATSVAENTVLHTLKRAGTNGALSAIGSVPGGIAGYIVGSEVHGQDITWAGIGDNALTATAVGGTFGAVTSLHGSPDAVAKTTENIETSPRTNLTESASTKFEGARQAVRDLLFGRPGEVGQLGTAMASDAKGSTEASVEQTTNSWKSWLDFAGGKGRVEATDIEHALKGIDAGTANVEALKNFGDAGDIPEKKALVAATLRPESRAAFLKMIDVSRDGSASAEAGFAKEVSADKQTLADLKLMTDRIGDPKLMGLIEAASKIPAAEAPIAPATSPSDLDALDAALARAPKPIIEPVEEAKPEAKGKVSTVITDEALRQPVDDGFRKLLDAAKMSGSPDHAAAFFAAVDANPRILAGVKDLAGQTPLQSVKDLAAMAEKPALRTALQQLIEASREGSTDAQKQAFTDTVNRDRSVIPDLQKLASRYDSAPLKALVKAADTADIELVYNTPEEGKALKSAATVISDLAKSGGTDTAQLNSLVRDGDSVANLQPHLRHIAERLGGEELAKKVDEAYAGRIQEVKVEPSIDDSFPAPREVQTVSIRSNQVKDFTQMMQTAEMLHESFLNPSTAPDAVHPDWYYNLLRAKAQSESGQGFEVAAKDYARKMNDPRFIALINDAYLPKQGVVLDTPPKTFEARTQREADAYAPFSQVMRSWPKVAEGETPSPASVLEYRSRVIDYLGKNPDLQRMAVEYGAQTNSSFEASVIDFYWGTKNLERFAPARPEATAGRPVERNPQQDHLAKTLVEGTIDPKLDFVKTIAKGLGSPAPHNTEFSRRMFNGEPRVSQDRPPADVDQWSVVQHGTSTIATVSGHPENLLRVQDFDNGQRIEYYGANGDKEPYTQISLPDHTNIKVVNPSVNGTSRFRVEFPLQGNYVTTDFPPGSDVIREIGWKGNITKIHQDGSVTMEPREIPKPFDPDVHESTRKVEKQAREAQEQRAAIEADTNRRVAVMSDSAASADARLEAAKGLKPQNMSVDQFKNWLEFAVDKSLDGNDFNYHYLDGSGLEAMKSKLENPDEYTTWAGRLKDFLAVPEAGTEKYPEWLARENFADMPNWLKNDVYQRFNPKAEGASDRLPAQVSDYFQANAEPQEAKTFKGKTSQEPFKRIGDDTMSIRMDRLAALNSAKPELTARLMELGAQDGRALQDVVRSLTQPFNNSVEYRDLLANTLPNAKDIYSVKVMLDALDKAGSNRTPDAEKPIDLEIAKRAAAALAGNARQASIAKELIGKINRRETTRGPKDFSTLQRYGLAAPSTEPAEAPSGWKLGGSKPAPEDLNKGSGDPVDGNGTGSGGTDTDLDSPELKKLRGESDAPKPETALEDAPTPAPEAVPAPEEVPPPTLAPEAVPAPEEVPPPAPAPEAVPSPASGEAPAPEKLEAAPVPAPTPAAEAEQPAPETAPERVESLPSSAEALVEKVGIVAPAGQLFGNDLYTSPSGTEYMIDKAGVPFEKVSGDHIVARWTSLTDQTQIWMDGAGHVWDLNNENPNIAIARDLPENVRARIINFGTPETDPENVPRAIDVRNAENENPGSSYFGAREGVMSTFYKDGSVEYSYEDRSKYIVGPRTAETNYAPAYETFKFASEDSSSGLTLTVNPNQAIMGVLPNGIGFSAKDLAGNATVFHYPDGVAHYEPGTTVSFDHNSVTVSQISGKQTTYNADGTSHEETDFGLLANTIVNQPTDGGNQ